MRTSMKKSVQDRNYCTRYGNDCQYFYMKLFKSSSAAFDISSQKPIAS
ncbi:MAG: hypothetical protein LBR54_04215 [Oscillospiraceae bacterium]|nr:hypothetical protein [Oscillospiraceae bacterium]